MWRKTVKRTLIGVFASYLLFSFIAGITLAEFSIKLPRNRIIDAYRTMVYQRVQAHHARLADVSIRTHDGLTLRAWFIEPEQRNGNAVILLHGVTDNRVGMSGYGEFLLLNGYSVLLPDARAHGESDGQLASYGLREGEDVHQWVDWIYEKHRPNCVYGMGESMGAGIILQSLASENRFCAVVAESSFADFREGAFDRASHYIGVSSTWGAQAFLSPAIEAGALYARLRYGLNLLKVSPRRAAAASSTPILLIHGAMDKNIRPQNSEWIHQADPNHSTLWEVPMAAHCGAWSNNPREFERRLLDWFSEHSNVPSRQP
jgi:dipeptidyl aminopeptidase/acylaminoacyl peptidase